MRLGEALARRAELQVRHGQVRDRLRASAVVQEGEKPAEDPATLLAELDRIADELERLIAAINLTNSHLRLPSGVTLTAALARRDVLALRQSALHAVAESIAQQQSRYSRTEIRSVRTLDLRELRRRVDALARDRRNLDVEIQTVNWAEELIRQPE